MAEEKVKKEAKEEAPEGEAPAAASGPKSSKKMLLIIGGVVLMLALIGAPVMYFVLMPSAKEVQEGSLDAGAALGSEGSGVLEGMNGDSGDVSDDGLEPMGAIFPFEPFTVNIQDGRFLRLQVQLEFMERDVPVKFYSRLVPLKDQIISALTRRNADDLLGERGRDSLKKDIKDLINENLRREEVKSVYFTQFVVQ